MRKGGMVPVSLLLRRGGKRGATIGDLRSDTLTSTLTERTWYGRVAGAAGVSVLSSHVYLFGPVLLVLTFAVARFWEGAGILAVAVFLFLPGHALVRALDLQLDSLETTFISLLAGGAILLTITNVFAMSPIDLSGESVLAGEVIVLFLLLIFGRGRQDTVLPVAGLTDWLFAMSVALAPLLLLRAVFQHDFFMGYDPFAASYFSDSIAAHSISPFSFSSHDVNFLEHMASGFYYFTAGLSLLSGLTTAEITRYGGLALLGASGGLVFLLVRAAFQRPLAGFLAAAFFISSPFVLERFVIYIRENFALALFLGMLLLLIKAQARPRASIVLFSGFLTGTIFQTHPLVSALAVAVWSALLLSLAFQGDSRREWLRVGATASAAIALFSLPSGLFVGERFFTDVLLARVLGLFGMLPPEHEAFDFWRRGIFWDDFNLLALGFAPLGLIFVAIAIRRRFAGPGVLLASPAAVIAGMLLLVWLGTPLPAVRTIVYLALGVSVLGGLGFALLQNAAGRFEMQLALAAAVGIILFFSARSLHGFEKWSPFEGGQVAAAKVVAERANSEDSLVLAPVNERALMGFAHVPDFVADRDVIIRILSAPSLEALANELDTLGARDRKIQFFMSKRFAGAGIFVDPNVLGGSGRPFTLLTLLRQNSPDGVSLGARPDSTSSVSTPLLHVVEFDLGAAYLYEITTAER